MSVVTALLWLVMAGLLCGSSALIGSQSQLDVVDGAVFVVLFTLALHWRPSAGTGRSLWLPALLVTVGAVARAYVAGDTVIQAGVAVTLFVRYVVTALLLLLALALTARRTFANRIYNVAIVGGGAWALGGGLLVFANVVRPPSLVWYLVGQALAGVAAGLFCALSGWQRPGSSTAARESS